MINEGKWFKQDSEDYNLYKKLVEAETRNNLKSLQWNGYDYYDGNYIRDNFNLNYNHRDYPTIDHKISIRHGFDNNIDFKVIGSIENLCYTKRSINSEKNKKNEKDFIEKYFQKD